MLDLDVLSFLLLLTCCFFVGLPLEANEGLLLRRIIGENVIMGAISSGILFLALWLMLSEVLESEWEQPILVQLCS